MLIATLPLLLAGLFGAANDDLAASPGDRWPGFRGVGTGWTAAADLPTTWSAPAWSAELPGEGQSSPIVFGESVFVTSIEGTEKEKAHVTCLSLADGSVAWTKSFEASARIEHSEMISRGAPTPALDAERVFAFFESGDFFCLDHDGELLWHVDLFARFGPFKGNHGVASSPVVSVAKSTMSFIPPISHVTAP